MKRRGFTLIEILAVIIILGIIALIAIPVVSNYIVDSRKKTYYAHEKGMEEAAKSLTIECINGNENCFLPVNNNSNDIFLSELIEKGFTQRLQNPQGNGYCNEELSYVRVTNISSSDYDYQACLYCGDYVTESDKCVDIGNVESGSAPVCGTVTGVSSEWTNKPRTITVGCTDPDNDCRYNTFPKTYKTTTVNDEIIISDMKNHTARCPVEVRVDMTPPTCELEMIGGTFENQTNWVSGDVKVRLKNQTDANSGLLTYGIGMSTTPDYNRNTEIDLTNINGLVTVFGYVKDNAGNENTCRTTLRTGIQKPDFDIYYGYHIFPLKEEYTTSGINVSNGTITVNDTNPTLTFDGMNKYTNAQRVALTTSGNISSPTSYKLSVDGGTNWITAQPKGSKRIEFELPGGTYSKYIFKLANKNIVITRLEIQQSRNDIIACKNVSVDLYPDEDKEKVKTNAFSFDGGSTFQDAYYKSFEVKNNAVSGTAQTKNDIGMLSVKKNYSIVKGDCSGPTISITYTPDSWTNGDVTLTGTGNDIGSGIIAYAFSKGSSVAYDSSSWKPVTKTTGDVTQTNVVTVNGNYYFNLKDDAGNIVSVKQKIDKIDKVIPICEIKNNSTLSCTDTGNTDYAASSIDGYIFGKDATSSGKYTSVTATNNLSINATVNDIGTWNLYAKDRAGNISKVASDAYYKVTYDKNGGDSCTKASKILRNGRSVDFTPTCSKTGYTFGGWSLDGTKTTSLNISKSITLKAIWSANSYTIKFNGNTNTSGSTADKPCVYDSNCTLTSNGFTKIGYTYSGWATSASGNVVYTDGATVKNLAKSGTYNLYAKWIANSYTIKFDGNGATSGSTSDKGCTYDANCTLTSNGFTRTGYTFTGWATSATGSVVHANGATVKNLVTSGTYTLYAKWTPNTYTIKFNGNTNTGGSTSDKGCTYDANCTLTSNGFTRTGYTFAGWATSASGSTSYANSATVKNLATSGTYNLYAKWAANKYTITYKAGSGSGSDQTQEVTYGTEWTTKDAIFAKDGYLQSGWSTTNGGSITHNLNKNQGAYNKDDNITLYATYKCNDTIKPTVTNVSVKLLSANSAKVTFNVIDGGCSGLDKYVVSFGGKSTTITNIDTKEATFTGLNVHNKFTPTVTAYDKAGNNSSENGNNLCVPLNFKLQNKTYAIGEKVYYLCDNWSVMANNSGDVQLIRTTPMTKVNLADSIYNLGTSIYSSCTDSSCTMSHCAWSETNPNSSMCWVKGDRPKGEYDFDHYVGYSWDLSYIRLVVNNYLSDNDMLTYAKNNNALNKVYGNDYVRVPTSAEVASSSSASWREDLSIACNMCWSMTKMVSYAEESVLIAGYGWYNIYGYGNSAALVYPVINAKKQ